MTIQFKGCKLFNPSSVRIDERKHLMRCMLYQKNIHCKITSALRLVIFWGHLVILADALFQSAYAFAVFKQRLLQGGRSSTRTIERRGGVRPPVRLTMAAMGHGAAEETSSSQARSCPSTAQSRAAPRPELQESLVYMQCCGQNVSRGMPATGPPDSHQGPGFFPQRTRHTTTPKMPSFRSPESVEMDEIMAAMVLTSLSCSPVVQSLPHTDPTHGPAGPAGEMECAGGELSDSGSSGYWSWDHGNVSPTPSPSVTEMDSSPDEGMHMEAEQWEELTGRKSKTSRGAYRCLWPGCGKVLTSSVGMKRHVRVLHLGSGSEHSQREEDFYYTKFSSEVSVGTGPLPQVPQAPHTPWASCGSPPSLDLQIPAAPRPRSNSSPVQPSSLSHSAPSSFWQIHTEHHYQACAPVQVTVASQTPVSQCWTPPISVCGNSNPQTVRPRCRSVSVGEQWLQQNTSRLQTMTSSPSRAHCSFRKGRGEAKKCRKVYGVERKDQWCTACRWKKACQRFPD